MECYGAQPTFDPHVVRDVLAERTLERWKVRDDKAQQKAEGR
jgi:hypothetical protein